MRRILVIAVIALASVTGLPGTAHAGGPTSVLVTQPGVSAGALYYTDAAYEELLGLLPSDETTGKPQPPGGGIDYNLTWMVHDVMQWRFDRVHVASDGTTWVSTSFSSDGVAGYEQLDDGLALARLLRGVLDESTTPSVVGADAEAGTPLLAPETRTVTRTEWFSLEGWRWLLPGALLGLLVGGAATRGRRTADEEPRRQLVEA